MIKSYCHCTQLTDTRLSNGAAVIKKSVHSIDLQILDIENNQHEIDFERRKTRYRYFQNSVKPRKPPRHNLTS